jgi:hypothetical protein
MPDVLDLVTLRKKVCFLCICSFALAGLYTEAAERTTSNTSTLSQIEEIPWPSKATKTSLPNEAKVPPSAAKTPAAVAVPVSPASMNGTEVKPEIEEIPWPLKEAKTSPTTELKIPSTYPKTPPAIAVSVSPASMNGTESSESEKKISPGRQRFRKPLRSINASIQSPVDLPKTTTRVDDDLALDVDDPFSNGHCRPWAYSSYQWEAPATRHLPLLFEEPNLERLGYTHGFCDVGLCDEPPRGGERIQPLISMANFIGRIPLIPYMAGVHPLTEPVYTLGTDRAGSPVPYRKYLPHCSLRGTIYQAGFMVGTAFIIP